MLRKTFLPAIFLLLAYGFTVSADFKVITAGVAIFLFGMLSLEEGFKTFTAGTSSSKVAQNFKHYERIKVIAKRG